MFETLGLFLGSFFDAVIGPNLVVPGFDLQLRSNLHRLYHLLVQFIPTWLIKGTEQVRPHPHQVYSDLNMSARPGALGHQK